MTDLKFMAEMPAFRRHVNFVRCGLGNSKTDIPTMLIRFDLNGRTLTAFTSNKELFCRTEIRVDNENGSEGSFAVMGDRIEKLLAQTAAEKAIFQVDDENLKITAGFLTVNFETFDGATLKSIEAAQRDVLAKEGDACFKLALEEGLVCARTCTSMTSVNPAVTHVEMRKGRILSSDGRKIMVFEHDSIPKDMELKIPAGLVADTITALRNIDNENVQIIAAPTYYYVKGNKNEFLLGIRRVDRDFPAVESQLENLETPTDEISLDKNVLDAMLKGVALGLPSEEVKVLLTGEGGGKEAYLEVSATNTLGRRSFERASCGRKAKGKTTFPISFKHLTDTLTVFKGDSVVDLLVVDTRNMLVVKDVTDVRMVRTVIPFRTDKLVEEEKKERAKADETAKKQAEATKKEKEDALTLTDGAVEQDVDII